VSWVDGSVSRLPDNDEFYPVAVSVDNEAVINIASEVPLLAQTEFARVPITRDIDGPSASVYIPRIQEGDVTAPAGIAVTNEGVYVTDFHRGNLLLISTDGITVFSIKNAPDDLAAAIDFTATPNGHTIFVIFPRSVGVLQREGDSVVWTSSIDLSFIADPGRAVVRDDGLYTGSGASTMHLVADLEGAPVPAGRAGTWPIATFDLRQKPASVQVFADGLLLKKYAVGVQANLLSGSVYSRDLQSEIIELDMDGREIIDSVPVQPIMMLLVRDNKLIGAGKFNIQHGAYMTGMTRDTPFGLFSIGTDATEENISGGGTADWAGSNIIISKIETSGLEK
jgi:hypothetical protein